MSSYESEDGVEANVDMQLSNEILELSEEYDNDSFDIYARCYFYSNPKTSKAVLVNRLDVQDIAHSVISSVL